MWCWCRFSSVQWIVQTPSYLRPSGSAILPAANVPSLDWLGKDPSPAFCPQPAVASFPLWLPRSSHRCAFACFFRNKLFQVPLRSVFGRRLDREERSFHTGQAWNGFTLLLTYYSTDYAVWTLGRLSVAPAGSSWLFLLGSCDTYSIELASCFLVRLPPSSPCPCLLPLLLLTFVFAVCTNSTPSLHLGNSCLFIFIYLSSQFTLHSY